MAGLDPAIHVRPAYKIPGSSLGITHKGRKEKDMAGNAEPIIELDRKRMTAMAQKDLATLNEVIADDLVYTHSSARLDTKASLIGNMASGSTGYTSVLPSHVTAQDLGGTVVLPEWSRISV